MMKIGDKVELVKDITYEGGNLKAGTKGTVSGMGEMEDGIFIAFFVEELFQAFIVRADSVK